MTNHERIVECYKLWYPTFYNRTVECASNGYHALLAVLDDGSRVEFSSLDNSLRDITRADELESDLRMSEDEWRLNFSRRLKSILHDRSMKQESLAEAIDISKVMLSKYVNGKATPSSYVVNRIARVLCCDTQELIEFDYRIKE